MPYTALNSIILLYLIEYKKGKSFQSEFLHSRLRQGPFFAGSTTIDGWWLIFLVDFDGWKIADGWEVHNGWWLKPI